MIVTPHRRKALVPLLMALALLLTSTPQAYARWFGRAPLPPPVPPSSPPGIHVTVFLIEALDGPPWIDPKIRVIVDQFEGAFRYSTYRLVARIPMTVPIGGEDKVALPDHRELLLSIKGFERPWLKLRVKIVKKPTTMLEAPREILNTEFRIVPGGTILIGGYMYHEGKLIVAISTR
jgi:hypothetical protein